MIRKVWIIQNALKVPKYEMLDTSPALAPHEIEKVKRMQCYWTLKKENGEELGGGWRTYGQATGNELIKLRVYVSGARVLGGHFYARDHIPEYSRAISGSRVSFVHSRAFWLTYVEVK